MIPAVYVYNSTNDALIETFTLNNAIECKVTETLNSAYECEVQFLVNTSDGAKLENYLKQNGNYICIACKPNATDLEQKFRVYNSSRAISGAITLNAEHITYAAAKCICFDNTVYADVLKGSAGTLMLHMTSSCAENDISCAFHSDITEEKNWSIEKPIKMSEAMTYARNVFGGDWYFNGTTCRLLESRGNVQRSSHSVEYGVNITDFNMSANETNAYTHIMPYAIGDDKQIVYAEPKFIRISENISTSFKPYLIDVTAAVAGEITALNVENAGKVWLIENKLQLIAGRTNYKISIVQRGRTAEHSDQPDLDAIALGDVVIIRNRLYGIIDSQRCIKVVYNSLLEMTESIELGTVNTNSISHIVAKNAKQEQQITNTEAAEASDEIPQRIIRLNDNSVQFEFEKSIVTWTASGSGDERYNFRKTTTDKPADSGNSSDADTSEVIP